MKGLYEKVADSGVWWIRYADLNGRIRRELAGTKSAATKLYSIRKTEVLQGRKLPANLRAKRVMFADIAKDALEYSRIHKRSHDDDVERMEVLCDWFAGAPADLTPKHIEDKLMAASKEREWKPATTNRYKALLSLTYRIAYNNGRVQSNPIRLIRRLPENNGIVRFLSRDEMERLRAAMQPVQPERWAAVQFAMVTGLRAGEQFGLKWSDLDLAAQQPQVNLGVTKNGRSRHVPLKATAIQALEIAATYSTPNRKSKVFLSRPYRAWFDAALKEAEIQDFTWHCLRHTFASTLIMAGVDIRTVAELMGHRSLQMTMRYAHLAPAHTAAAVAKLDDLFKVTDKSTGDKTRAIVQDSEKLTDPRTSTEVNLPFTLNELPLKQVAANV
jgi:integrase